MSKCDFLDTPIGWKGARCFHINDGTPCYSPHGQIVQIIPAPAGMVATYKDDASPDAPILASVACLALVEDCAGFRTIEGIDIQDGVSSFCTDAKNFAGYQYAEHSRT